MGLLPGSPCSIHFGTGVTTAAPGSYKNLYLVVSDIAAARDELGSRGAEVSEPFHFTSLGGKRVRGSVMFSDIRDFTQLAESLPPEESIDLLNTYYTLMFNAISGHGGIVSLIEGDGLMAVFGAPCRCRTHFAMC